MRPSALGGVGQGCVCLRRDLLLATAVTVIAVLYVRFAVANSFHVWPADASAYWEMAQKTILPSTQWEVVSWHYLPRVLVPSVVHAVFGGSIFGFICIGISALWVSNLLIGRLSALYTSDWRAAGFLMALFSTNYTVLLHGLANICLVDLPTMPIVFLALYLYLRFCVGTNWAWPRGPAALFALTLVIGTLSREAVIFYAAVFVMYPVFLRRGRLALRTFALCLPSMVTYWIVRFWLGPFPWESLQPDLAQLIGPYLEWNPGQYRQLFSAFGGLWVLIPLALAQALKEQGWRSQSFLLPILGFGAGIGMSLLAAEENRYLFFMAFPLLVPAFAAYMSQVNAHLRDRCVWGVLGVTYVLRLLLCYRPSFEATCWPFAHLMADQSFRLFLAIVATAQIVILLWYAIAGSGRFRALSIRLFGFCAGEDAPYHEKATHLR